MTKDLFISLVGKKVGEFNAQAYVDEKFITVTEQNLIGKWTIVCFYPADFTFVCPTELEDLQNESPKLKELGVQIFSVSTDTHFTHKAWHDHSSNR